MDSPAPCGPPLSRRRFLCPAAVLVILIAATALRIRGALNDLWLDEIWSVHLVTRISSPWQVFTRMHHENNHYLNSLWLYWVGPHGNWPGYRIPSLLAGVGSVVLAGVIGRRRDAPMAFFAMLLTGFSYVLVLYSSEARGYSTAVFFSLLSYYLLDLYLKNQRWWLGLMFSLATILALLSQLISVGVVLAALVWSTHWFVRRRLPPREIIVHLLICFVPAAVCITGLYFIDIRHVISGGGTLSTPLDTYVTALAWALGGPPTHVCTIAAGMVAMLILGTGAWLLFRAETGSWSFFVGAILVFPVMLVVIRASSVIYVRHFLIAIVFLLILLSFVLSRLWQKGWPGRSACVVVLAAYLVLNGLHILALFKDGRGHYAGAVDFMVANSREPVVTVGGDHDFRIGAMIQFYVLDHPPAKPVTYDIQSAWPPEGPEWVVFNRESFLPPGPPATRFADKSGNHYQLAKTFPSAPLSGLHWFVYHNEGRPGKPSPQ